MDNLNWLDSFPPLLALEASARDILTKSARIVEAPIGTIGYREGGACGAQLPWGLVTYPKSMGSLDTKLK